MLRAKHPNQMYTGFTSVGKRGFRPMAHTPDAQHPDSSHVDSPAESKSRGWDPKHWVSLVPYGVNQQHPNGYKDILQAMWENRDRLGYAWRILNNGCCDGCSLGTTGLHDWTMKGVHLCNIRLQLLRFNTAPAMDYRLLENVEPLRNQSECANWDVLPCRWSAAKAIKASAGFHGTKRLRSLPMG
jgi:hypothetical protein